MNNKPYQGSCLCKAITFEIDQFLPEAAHCHCSMCRKFHGAAYATFAGVLEENFRWLSGESSLKSYRAENETVRQFCDCCGSSLTFYSPKATKGIIEIALGVMDSQVPVRPDANIFMQSAASWTELDNNLPCFAEGRV